MPRKGMRSIFFSSSHTTPPSTPLRAPPTPLYSFSKSMMNETISNAEAIINKWNPDTSPYAKVTSLFYESKIEAKNFLKSVKDLQRAMHFLISKDASSEVLIQAQKLMQTAMRRLEKEFYQILSINRDHLDPESISGRSSLTSRSSLSICSDYESEDDVQIAGNSITQVENEASIAMSDLKSIADCMISSGYGKECVKIYNIIRKSIIDEGLYRLGIEPLSSRRIHKMDWEVLDLKIKNWLKAVKIAVKTLFHGERILCDHVFSSSDSIRESCFSEISKEGAITLFHFPELVIKNKKSSEKIFRVLDLYSSIANLWPEIESIFSFESSSVVRSQAISSLVKLSETVRVLLTEFESATQKDSSKSSVQGGGVHPFTKYVMNYVSILSDYIVILTDIMTDWSLPKQELLPDSYFESLNTDDTPASTISIRFAWLILILLCKLDGKAEFYKDVSLSYLFLANNLQFIISKVRTSNLQFLLGEDWVSQHEVKVKQFAANYERVGWHKVLSTVPTAKVSLEEAKSCFKRFNSAFETAYRTQSSWIVPDSKLREEIKVSICKKLVPAYQEFYQAYRRQLRVDRNAQNVRFSPDDLGNYLSDLFYGTSPSTSSSVSSHGGQTIRYGTNSL